MLIFFVVEWVKSRSTLPPSLSYHSSIETHVRGSPRRISLPRMERGGGGKVCFNRVKLFSLDLSALSPPWNAARYSTRQRAVPSRDFSDGIRRPVKYAVSNFRLQLIHESSRRRACRFELSSSLPFPLLNYYCYQDQVSMDQKNSHSSYCVNRVRNRFSIEERWRRIGKRKGCEIDRMERKWEAIIGDFYGFFFLYI